MTPLLLDLVILVAPHAGAWIETHILDSLVFYVVVAPHAGAWIETSPVWRILKEPGSPPMRGRGLKQVFTGESGALSVSPPMRGRGLKPFWRVKQHRTSKSPPMRGRGLKPFR